MRDSEKPAQASPFMVAVVGASDTGKTTLLVRLIGELKKMGLRVGAVKHSRTAFRLDIEGKDSHRLKEAGAETVLLSSPGAIALIADCDEKLSPRDAAKRFFGSAEIVLVEGWKDSELPKILIAGEKGKSETGMTNIIAEVGEQAASGDTPLFAPDAVRELADFILSFSRRSRPGSSPSKARDPSMPGPAGKG